MEATQPNTDISTKLFFKKLTNVLIYCIYLKNLVSQSISDNDWINRTISVLFGQSIGQYWSHLVQSICQSIRKSVGQSSFIHFNYQSFNSKVFWVLTGCFCKHEFWLRYYTYCSVAFQILDIAWVFFTITRIQVNFVLWTLWHLLNYMYYYTINTFCLNWNKNKVNFMHIFQESHK